MARLLGHRQTKGTETDKPDLMLPRHISTLPDIYVRRAKALSFSGCEPRPATFAPAGSNWSSRGGNEAAEASGVEGPVRDLATMQAVMRMNTEQASKRVMRKPTRR